MHFMSDNFWGVKNVLEKPNYGSCRFYNAAGMPRSFFHLLLAISRLMNTGFHSLRSVLGCSALKREGLTSYEPGLTY